MSIEIDFAESIIRLDGEPFACADLIAPPDVDPDEPESERTLSFLHSPHVNTVWVPLENGTVAALDHVPDSPTLDLAISSPVCYQCPDPNASPDWLWLPITLCVRDGALSRLRRPGEGTWEWTKADPDWCAEQIHRLARMQVRAVLSGPRCTMRPIREWSPPSRTPAASVTAWRLGNV